MSVLLCLTLFGVLAMVGSGFRWATLVPLLSGLGFVATAVLLLYGWNSNEHVLNGMLVLDNAALAFSLVVLLACSVTALAVQELTAAQPFKAEVQAVLLFALIGAVVMTSYTNLLLLFLGIEIMALSSYVLTGLRKKDTLSNEAALKYFLMGAFSTAVLLLGMAFLYGASGSFELAAIAPKLTMQQPSALVLTGTVLMLSGMFFKVSVMPFQFWTPDVYQGAPTIVTGFLATAGKIAAFAALLRLIEKGLFPLSEQLEWMLAPVVALTVVAGNLMALWQKSQKRMLAFSSIAHAGYLLLALVVVNEMTADAVLFYSVAYLLAAFMAFVLLDLVEQHAGGDRVEHFNGMAKHHPLMAGAWTIAMLSLAGIPVTAGFMGKFYIFSTALSEGQVLLVVLSVVGSIASVYYYLRPVLAVFSDGGSWAGARVSVARKVMVVALMFLTVFLGVVPSLLTDVLR
ncbi:MAG: NADH-quinone oxidoreductase subunit N [Chitinophagales bacterium]|nr:NADH-quinone oxidoreductase subunit N [Chitinophagales bacterium]MDW8428406.1 NADH-quinone oxidoreductase subunit N [Chitinophagales bacterium]